MKDSVAMSLGIVGVIGLLVLTIIRTVLWIQFDLSCNQYLKRAADANNIELAQKNIEVAVKYLEKRDLTNGVVSIFLHQPENDIGFWYTNLKACQSELFSVKPDASQLEKSNILMKLRETLLDHTKEGTRVTGPSGISIYPLNALYFWLFMMSGILTTIFFGKFMLDNE